MKKENATSSSVESIVNANVKVSGLSQEAWETWLAYRKEIKKPLKEISWPRAKRRLALFGHDQMLVVDQSIANGWQGLFPLHTKTSTPKVRTNSTPAHRIFPDLAKKYGL